MYNVASKTYNLLISIIFSLYTHGPGADPGFLKGGGVQARIQDFSQAPSPWTLSAWRHPTSENLKNTPTLGHSQAPPPMDIVRVTSSALRKIEKTSPLLLDIHKRGGSNFGPNVKKPTSWPKRGGPDPLDPPPPWIRHWCGHFGGPMYRELFAWRYGCYRFPLFPLFPLRCNLLPCQATPSGFPLGVFRSLPGLARKARKHYKDIGKGSLSKSQFAETMWRHSLLMPPGKKTTNTLACVYSCKCAGNVPNLPLLLISSSCFATV